VHGGNNMSGTATYTKVGRLVHVMGDCTSAPGSSTTNIIYGLPFNCGVSHSGSFHVGWTNTGVEGGYVGNGNNYLVGITAGSNSDANISAGGRIIFSAFYIIA